MSARPIDAPVGIVLVNWNRWEDTIECLESVLRSTVPVQVVVVDNASADGSADKIMAWARGEQLCGPASEQMATFSTPPLQKPLPCQRLTAAELAAGAGDAEALLTVIDSGGNLGFAGGNNMGLRLLMANPGIGEFWLLNNDTVVDPGAAGALALQMRSVDKIGMCGTVVRFYYQPELVQALNGHKFSLWTGQSRGINARTPASLPFDPGRIAAATDFVFGASLGVSRAFLETVGPMEEGYFLYFEEIDWATRGRRRFRTGFAHGATVFHKEGGSIGSSGTPGARSGTSEYWLTRSRLAFMRRHHPWLLPWHWLLAITMAGRRMLSGQGDKAGAILRALAGRPYR